MSGDNTIGAQGASAVVSIAGIAVLPHTAGNIYATILTVLAIVGGLATITTLVALKVKKSRQ